MSAMPSIDSPLYNHPLPKIERWLQSLGCEQQSEALHCWTVSRPAWQAEICLEIEELVVRYLKAGADGSDIERSFRYSLSRQDIEGCCFFRALNITSLAFSSSPFTSIRSSNPSASSGGLARSSWCIPRIISGGTIR